MIQKYFQLIYTKNCNSFIIYWGYFKPNKYLPNYLINIMDLICVKILSTDYNDYEIHEYTCIKNLELLNSSKIFNDIKTFSKNLYQTKMFRNRLVLLK